MKNKILIIVSVVVIFLVSTIFVVHEYWGQIVYKATLIEDVPGDINWEYIYDYFDVKDAPVYKVDDTWEYNPFYDYKNGEEILDIYRTYWEKDGIIVYKDGRWYDTNTGDASYKYTKEGKEFIRDKAILIKDENTLNTFIYNYSGKINFKKEMLILCFFIMDSQWKHHPEGYSLEKYKLKNNNLSFRINANAVSISIVPDANLKKQKMMMVKMKKKDIANIKFESTSWSRGKLWFKYYFVDAGKM